MKRFTLALAAGSLLISSSAMAQSARAPGGFYVGGSLGTITFWDDEDELNGQDIDIEYDAFGFFFAGQAGYFLNDNVRLEGELAYQSTEGELEDEDNDTADFDSTVVRGSVSAYYDFNSLEVAGLSGIRPYGGGGIGFASAEVDIDGGGEDDDTEVTFHGEVGASYDLGPNVALVPATRLEYTDETWATLFKVGLRYAF